MSDSTSSLPIAGWYPDPENTEGERWWNGASWSDHRRPRTVTPAAPPAGPMAAAAPPVSPAPAAGDAPSIPVPPVEAATPGAVPSVAAPPPASAVDPVNPYAVSNPYAAPNPYSAPAPYSASAYGTAQPYTANPYSATAPYGYGPAPATRNTVALVGMIISLVALLLSFWGVTGIAGGIVSIVGLQRSGQLARAGITPNGRGQAIAGIIVGFGGALLTWIILGIAAGITASYNSRYGY